MANDLIVYRTKHIQYKGKLVSILLQGDNGPCALLAIANILLLQLRITLDPDISFVSTDQVVQCIANVLLDRSDGTQTDALHHAVSLLPKLNEGLHVNVKFASIDSFEASSELDIFSLLKIPLYHCWLPSDEDVAFPYLATGDFDSLQISLVQYDALKSQLETGVIQQLTSAQETLAGEAQTLERWFELNSGQITAEGLFALNARVQENELAVLFRNNHFSTITKHRGSLYLLITDEGFHGNTAVWESFNQLDGDAVFLKSLSLSHDLLEPHYYFPAAEAGRQDARRQQEQPGCCTCTLM